MVIEVLKDQKVLGEQLFKIKVEGKVIYSNMSYDDLIAITIGDLDKCEIFLDEKEGLV